jgi:hypothetical protein
MRELVSVTRIPPHPLVPAPPRHVPLIEPLVELILPPTDTKRPRQPDAATPLPPVPLAMMFPEFVETRVLAPVTIIPSLEFPPMTEPVPVRVIDPMPVDVMVPAVSTEIPVAVVPFPLLVPVMLIAPFREVMLVLATVTTIPRQSLVPREVFPVNVMGAEPDEVMLPADATAMPWLLVVVPPPVPIKLIPLPLATVI